MNLKTTEVYRSPDNIQNLKIRIRIKALSDEGKEETKIFVWQQKHYSKDEIQFYKDKANCVTILEKKYHEDVENLIYNNDILFSFIHEDHYDVDCDYTKDVDKNELGNKQLDYEEYLVKAMNDACLKDTFEIMYIMADLGEYHHNKWLKDDHILCTVKYNHARKYLLIYPDFTYATPYIIKTSTNKFVYYIEDVTDKMPLDVFLKETAILNKISSHREKLKLHGMDDTFAITPAENILNIQLSFEILWGKRFENGGIYIQYYIDLPKDYSTESSLTGTTFSSYSSNYKHHFGYPFEVCLKYNLNNEGKLGCPYIYFEVVSKDFWSCFRIEGLTYTALPVFQPGCYNYKLQCLRICPSSPLGNLRRYFLGEYPGYSDITWCSIPKYYDKSVLNKYGVNTISTGELGIRINVLHQSQNINHAKQRFMAEKFKMSSLVKSIEQVLLAFNDAKKKMIEARKNI